MKNIYKVFSWNVEKRQVCLEDKPQVRKWTFPVSAKAALGWLFFSFLFFFSSGVTLTACKQETLLTFSGNPEEKNIEEEQESYNSAVNINPPRSAFH